MITLVPKFTHNLLTCLSVASFTMRKVGKYTVPDLPAYKVNPAALRMGVKGQEQMSLNMYNDLVGQYKKYRELPQCRYFAFEHKNRIYHVFNAYHYPMGRMINEIATKIRGKHTPHYKNSQANVKNGDICVVVNAEDPLFTGRKLLNKTLSYHTGYIGHLKTFQYRAVLNKKPELLYYYLLRKSMPKNKISQQYLKNLKLFRGPTHTLPNIPQFAPDRFIHDPLTQIDFKKYLEEHPEEFKQTFKGEQEVPVGRVRGEPTEEQIKKMQEKPAGLETDDDFSFERKTRLANKLSNDKIESLVRLQKRLRRRYKTVRAPYNKKPQYDPGYRMFYSEKEAKKTPHYEVLANEELNEEDDEVIDDPLKRKGFDK